MWSKIPLAAIDEEDGCSVKFMCPPLQGVAEEKDNGEPDVWYSFRPVHVGIYGKREPILGAMMNAH